MKFSRYFKIKYKKTAKHLDQIYVGEIGLKCQENFNFSISQFESSLKSLKRIIKKKNFLILRSTPFWFLTRKPRDVRMGRGKGSPTLKVFPIKSGKILFEIKSIIKHRTAVRALNSCRIRLPIKTVIINKSDKCKNYTKGSW